MAFTQKEEGLDGYNSLVLVNGVWTPVPESPSLLQIDDVNSLQFQTPDVQVDNPRDDVVYLVALVNDALVLVLVPIVQGDGGDILDAAPRPRRRRHRRL